MSDRYSELLCPACQKPLREFRNRFVCDSCNGIMVAVADLSGAIEDLTSVVPGFAWDHEKPSQRACPACRTKMTICRIILELEGEVLHPKPELDRCEAHGVWFDSEELAKVFEKIAGKGHGAKSPSAARSKMRDGDKDQGRWSAMFPKFGGHGGW